MCERSILLSFIYYIYNFIWIGIPAIYILAFFLYRSKRKVYIKAFKYVMIWLVIFCIPKFIGWTILDTTCYNCAINNKCSLQDKNKGKDDNMMTNKTTTEEKTTASTTSTTKKVENQNPTGTNLGKTAKGYEITNVNGATYINGLLIVNKTYPVPENFVPTNTKNSNPGNYTNACQDCINIEAYNEWTKMKADAASVGINLWIQSGYRPYKLQEKLYNNYVSRDGKSEADRYSARPGYSEHQTGLCFDINNPSRSFNGTTEAKWINDNAYRFGYILRYPKGKENETGYMYESWHVRYVGKELAETLYNNGDWITLEDYLGITSEYAN